MSIELIDLHPAPADLKQLVQSGFKCQPRQLPAWVLYDAKGSRLFAQICEQPEYGLTRIEIKLLEENAPAIAKAVGDGVIVEFGIGNARKVSPLLNAIRPSTFVALDISQAALRDSLTRLANTYPMVSMLGICCDHSSMQVLPPHPRLEGVRCIGFFPGSSLGNFTPKEAVAVLRRFRKLLGGGPLLLGLDQPRDPTQLEAAYNDAAGISAAFARNLLHRLNRELKADFRPDHFSYRARWQEEFHRIEMALVSRCSQTIVIDNSTWSFSAGEPLITEYSVKYNPQEAARLAEKAGWRINQRWHDSADSLSLHLLEPSD